MAQYFEDFASGTVGAAPSGWTELISASAVTTTVENGGDDKVLQLNQTTGSTLVFVTRDDVDSDADADDAEVLVKFQMANLTNATGNVIAGVCVRATSAANGYYFGPRTSTQLRLSSVAGGSPTTIASATISALSTGVWYWIRFRANGTTLQGRLWADGGSEPGTWDINTTNGTYSAADSVGVVSGTSTSSDPIYDVVGIGTNGDAAPDSAGADLDIAASPLALSGALTASGNLQRDLNLSASAVSLAGTLSPSGDLAFYVPMLDVSAGALALSGALTATGDVQIGTAFDLSTDAVALAGSVTASGDIQIAEEELLDVAAGPVSISGAVSVSGDLAYLVPQLDVEASALALSGSVVASGDITPELHVDLGSGTVALSGSVDIAGDLGIGTTFDLSTDPIVVSGAVATSGDIAAEVVDVSAAAVWSYVLANGKTAAQTMIENNEMLRIIMSGIAGKSSGVGTSTETYFGTDGTTPRIVATFDDQGNRVSVTVDGSP